MHPTNPHNPNLMQVASQAQNMAANTKQERLAMAFQMVSMVSVAVVGVTAAAQLIRDLRRHDHGHEQSRGR
jgi:hypothetical protein